MLQIKVDGSLKNTTYPKVNQDLVNSLNVKFLNLRGIMFQDDGSSFTYKLLIPKGIIDLIHNIKPHSAGDANFNEDLLQHCCILLSVDKHAENSILPADCTECTFNAVSSWAGTWTVQVFASLWDRNVMNVSLKFILLFTTLTSAFQNNSFPTILLQTHLKLRFHLMHQKMFSLCGIWSL